MTVHPMKKGIHQYKKIEIAPIFQTLIHELIVLRPLAIIISQLLTSTPRKIFLINTVTG